MPQEQHRPIKYEPGFKPRRFKQNETEDQPPIVQNYVTLERTIRTGQALRALGRESEAYRHFNNAVALGVKVLEDPHPELLRDKLVRLGHDADLSEQVLRVFEEASTIIWARNQRKAGSE